MKTTLAFLGTLFFATQVIASSNKLATKPLFKTMDMKINTAKSKVKWTGRKVTGSHWGYVNIKSGNVKLEGSDLSGGMIVMDMNTINVADIPKNKDGNKKLVGHLKNNDFFATDKFKTATLTITDAMLGKGGHYDVQAKLKIKNIEKPVNFKANVMPSRDGIKLNAKLKFNRTHYGIKYGSGTFFKNLGDRMIKDDVEIEVNLMAKK